MTDQTPASQTSLQQSSENVVPIQSTRSTPRPLHIGSDEELARMVILDLRNTIGEMVGYAGSNYTWAGTHWRNVTDSEFYRTLQVYDGASYSKDGRVRLSENKVRSILALVYRQTEKVDFFDRPLPGVAVQNGFLKISAEGAELVNHDPAHTNRHVLKAHWSTDVSPASEPVLLKRLVQGCFSGDDEAETKTRLLQEIAGAVLIDPVQTLSAPKAVVLFGDKASNGKSQILELLRGLVPDTASTCLSPAQMSDERHIIALDGKLLNAVDEIGDRAIASEKFKAVVTGDRVTGRSLYRNGQSFRPQALHVFTANGFPEFKQGMDPGVARRLLVLVFDRVIPKEEQIPGIGRLIARTEVDQLLAWAVQGSIRLLSQGTFTAPQSSREALQDWLQTSDPVKGWLSDPDWITITESAEDKTLVRHAYPRFQMWCRDMGIRDVEIPNQARFTRRIKVSGIKGVLVRRLADGNHIYGVRVVGSKCRRGDA